ncbi:MAG TPA: aminoacyl-histidine dipeptidase [Chitinophagaceae bacterium]|nr:aminoacyl-histidine dipeptidase [Chitinophagaceae bacterium]
MDIKTLEPKAIWKNFSALNAVPRPSRKEEKVIAFIQDFGKKLGLETHTDDTGNVVIRKPATQSMENRKIITLQSHLDMVCQKNNDTLFDFDTEGIKTLIDGDWVTADGTTLGADNGMGVAAIMSILESNDIVHPELEALFTIDEETGMTGAFGLKPGFLKGEILLNLDTEEDDEIDIGCAGGVDVTAEQTYPTITPKGDAISLSIKRLQGGHSGMEIHKGLGNANVLLARLLYPGITENIQLVEIEAGGLRNAIPREANALFYVENADNYLQKAEQLKKDILNEYKAIEPNIVIDFSIQKNNSQALKTIDSIRFIQALNAAHNGVYRMSPDIDNLVETSNNIANVNLKDGKAQIGCLTRSSVDSTKTDLANQLTAAFQLGGLEVTLSGAYPGWQPNPNASITTVLENIYREKFNEAPKVIACHAGLECGIIGANYPEMEMISFGPTIEGAHSPDERVSISSVQKFWGFLLEVLQEIPEK